MIIQEMFENKIKRDIRGVIKADQTNEADVLQELEEYVVTRELHKHFSKFYENYLKSIDGKTDKMGVWISGFFGSGKSHFLKILSYLLENKKVGGKYPIEFFEDKIEDPILLANMNKVAAVPTETILFNIDSKSPLGNREKNDAILRILLKVFYEHQGYYGDNFVIAELEKYLDDEGYLEAFKKAFKEIAKEPWEERRNSFYFDGHYVKEALLQATNMTEESINYWLTHKSRDIEISIEKFAQDVKEYIDKQDENFHLVFLIDEVGQYIGDRRDLMLNLQTITENLGTICEGKAWIIVTSQESIDSLVKVRGDDFSRIQGRFDTRLSMSSISVDEVIQKRILEKKEYVEKTLKAIYPEKGPILRNVITFRESTADLKGYENAQQFSDVYPFIPYQFKLLQKVFEQIRRHGSSGKHLSEGERSMLSAFREAGIRYMHEEEGTLIPFYAFYDTIREFLQPTVSRVIDGAAENEALNDDPFNIDLLKVLFMIKYVKEVPANIENITTLMVTHIDEDKLQLREKVEASLQKLISQTLIQKNGDIYIFLTDDEQDVNREIKQITVEPEELKRVLAESIFDDFYSSRKFSYSKHYDFNFNRKMDEKEYGAQTASIGINLLSPLSEYYHESEQKLAMMTSGSNEFIVRLRDNGYLEEFEEVIKITKYRDKKNFNQQPENIQNILINKQAEARERTRRGNELLKEALKQGEFFVHGNVYEVKGSSIKERIDDAFTVLVDNVYYRLSYIKDFIGSESELKAFITQTSDQMELLNDDASDPNYQAKSEIDSFIKMQEANNQQVRIKPIYDRFMSPPYGWRQLNIAKIVVQLLKEQKIRIRYHTEYLDPQEDVDVLMTVLTNIREADKAIVQERKKVDERLIRDVRGIIDELFGRRLQATDEDGMIAEIRELIDRQIEQIEQYKLKHNRPEYPGLSLLDKGLEYFNRFDKSLDNLSFFKLFQEMEDDLFAWIDDVELIKNFLDNHREIFDEALATIDEYENIKAYIYADETRNAIERLKDIVNNPVPYREIKHIPELVYKFQSELERILAVKKQETIETIEKDQEEAYVIVGQEGVSEQTKEKVEKYYINLVEEAEATKDVLKVDAIVTQSKSYLRELNQKVREEMEKYKRERKLESETIPDDHQVATTPKVLTKKVKLTQVVPIQTLATEAEVDQYIQTLSRKLKDIIKENKKIEFIE